jgi:hypothetical protein
VQRSVPVVRRDGKRTPRGEGKANDRTERATERLTASRTGAIAVVVSLTALIITGCGGPPRTTAGFCSVYHQQEQQYLAQYNRPSSSDGLADLVDLIGAVSDWVPIFEKLDQAAPQPIEPDVQNILDSLKQEEQATGQELTNPLAGLASGLEAAMMSSASWQNLNTFIEQNCGSS